MTWLVSFLNTPALATAALTTAGAICGAFIGSALQARRERAKDRRSHLAVTYASLVQEVAALARRGISPESRGESLMRLAHVKAVLAATAPANVVAALADFERAGANLVESPSQEALLRVVTTIRRQLALDSRFEKKASGDDLRAILLGVE